MNNAHRHIRSVTHLTGIVLVLATIAASLAVGGPATATTALTSPAEAKPERDATRAAPATTTTVVPPRTGRLGPGLQGSWR